MAKRGQAVKERNQRAFIEGVGGFAELFDGRFDASIPGVARQADPDAYVRSLGWSGGIEEWWTERTRSLGLNIPRPDFMLGNVQRAVAAPNPRARVGSASPFPPSDKQLAFIRKLAEERGVEVPAVDSKVAASREIDRLMALPRAARPPVAAAAPVAIEDGMYKLGDDIFKVQHAVHGSGNQYAKKLVRATETGRVFGTVDQGRWTFEYAPGAVRRLRPEHRMTIEEAKKFGALYGTCCVCGRTLTDEDSIAAGIGPVCAGRL